MINRRRAPQGRAFQGPWTLLCLTFLAVPGSLAAQSEAALRSAAEVIESAGDGEWRELDQANAVYIQLASGLVVLELAPELGPRHVENVKALVRDIGAFIGFSLKASPVMRWSPIQCMTFLERMLDRNAGGVGNHFTTA